MGLVCGRTTRSRSVPFSTLTSAAMRMPPGASAVPARRDDRTVHRGARGLRDGAQREVDAVRRAARDDRLADGVMPRGRAIEDRRVERVGMLRVDGVGFDEHGEIDGTVLSVRG